MNLSNFNTKAVSPSIEDETTLALFKLVLSWKFSFNSYDCENENDLYDDVLSSDNPI